MKNNVVKTTQANDVLPMGDSKGKAMTRDNLDNSSLLDAEHTFAGTTSTTPPPSSEEERTRSVLLDNNDGRSSSRGRSLLQEKLFIAGRSRRGSVIGRGKYDDGKVHLKANSPVSMNAGQRKSAGIVLALNQQDSDAKGPLKKMVEQNNLLDGSPNDEESESEDCEGLEISMEVTKQKAPRRPSFGEQEIRRVIPGAVAVFHSSTRSGVEAGILSDVEESSVFDSNNGHDEEERGELTLNATLVDETTAFDFSNVAVASATILLGTDAEDNNKVDQQRKRMQAMVGSFVLISVIAAVVIAAVYLFARPGMSPQALSLPSPSLSPTNTSASGTPGMISNQNACGDGIVGDGVCSDSSLCCSKYGYCGRSAEHCSTTTFCGDGVIGNRVCLDSTLCCSQYGYCGSTSDYCVPAGP
jgi:hypothetical protein